MDLNTQIFSGFNTLQNAFLKAKNTYYLGLEDIGMWKDVPTYISVCPYCNFEHKWRTTGLLPGYLECGKCHQKFKD